MWSGSVAGMKTLVFDSSALISLSETCSLSALDFLKKKSGVRFLAPESVHAETVETPLKIRKYSYSALRIKRLFDAGVVERGSADAAQTREIMKASNNLFFVGGRALKLIQEGEAACVAVMKQDAEAKFLAIDEKTLRLLVEAGGDTAVDRQLSESRGGAHGGDGRKLAALPVELEKGPDIDVGHAVAIGRQEGGVAEIASDASEPATRHRLLAGLRQRDLPAYLGVRVVDLDLACAERDGDVAVADLVGREVLADGVALEPEAEHELRVPVVGVRLHDVPEDGPPPDLDHRLGAKLGLLAKSRPQASGQDGNLHVPLELITRKRPWDRAARPL